MSRPDLTTSGFGLPSFSISVRATSATVYCTFTGWGPAPATPSTRTTLQCPPRSARPARLRWRSDAQQAFVRLPRCPPPVALPIAALPSARARPKTSARIPTRSASNHLKGRTSEATTATSGGIGHVVVETAQCTEVYRHARGSRLADRRQMMAKRRRPGSLRRRANPKLRRRSVRPILSFDDSVARAAASAAA